MPGSAETARDVGFRFLFPGIGEDLGRLPVFDEAAHVHEGGVVRDAGGLLHVVGDDDDGEVFFQVFHQVFDFQRSDGVQGGTGFVHQQDLRTVGNGARDAQALLLAAGKAVGAFMQLVLHFVPQGGSFQAALHCFIQFRAAVAARHAEGEDDVFINAFGERVVFLEDHAHPLAQGDDFHARVVQAGAVYADVPFMAHFRDQVVHAVDVAEQGGFPAAGGADKGRHLVGFKGHAYVEENLLVSVMEAEVLYLDDGIVVCGGWFSHGMWK